jgi:uncharacterized protein (TIGR03066 family)
MKKVSWKIAAYMSVVLLIFSIYSCGNDDEDSVGSRAQLVGIWNGVSGIEQEWKDGDLIHDDKEDYDATVEFKEDGTFIERDRDGGNSSDNVTGKWSYSGNKLTLTDDEGEEDTIVYTVTKLTKNEFVKKKKQMELYGNIMRNFHI